MGKIIKTFHAVIEVIVLDYIDGYFGICAGSVCGYTNEMWLNKTDEIKTFISLKKKQRRELKALADAKKQQQYEQYKKENEKTYIAIYGKQKYEKAKAGHYWLGMSSTLAAIVGVS